MHSPLAAIAWEFWSANRRGWLLVLTALAVCGTILHVAASSIRQSEGMQFLAYMPLTVAVILAVSFCNFTDRNRRDGIAGFPRHLFQLPVNTRLMVTCAMICSVLSVVTIYAAWVLLVLQPLDVEILFRWPVTLLAAFVVFYQAIVWCLCGFRLTRVVLLSLVATILVAVGFLPVLRPKADFWASEFHLSVALVALVAAAHVATIVTVSAQRRGGVRGWAGLYEFVERLAAAIPKREPALKSSEAALFWMEWRRTGFVLPTAVLLMTALILGPVLAFTGRGHIATTRAEMWLMMMPMLLAFPIGLGFAKPDFWSLDLALSPFIATRPVTGGQLLAAKLKSAAYSTVVAWAILLTIAPICIYLFCDTKHWHHFAGTWAQLYAQPARWLLPILFLTAAILVTWSLLVSHLWLGHSGRPGLYYSVAGIALAAFVTWFFFFIWWQDHPRSRGNTMPGILPWLPWALAAVVTAKTFGAVLLFNEVRRRQLVSGRSIATFTGIWLIATACLVLGGWFMSSRIEWFRNMMMLAALCAMPLVSIAVAPFAISWNRHR
jgi:hypothetical protein